MPRVLLSSRVPVDLSIVEFDPVAGEEIFLTYTWDREEGPPIKRTGMGPPFMQRIGGRAQDVITHPFALRAGSWLVQDAMGTEELNDAGNELQRARNRDIRRQDLEVLKETLEELRSLPSHETRFRAAYPNYEVIGIQGCGDLTMNYWNVAFINNPLGKRPNTLICLRDEPLDYRTYSCLVKWKADHGPGRVTIEDLQFKRDVRPDRVNEMVWVRFGTSWLPRADRIAFAVSNQQVIRDGKIVPTVTTCHQFSDLRHLIQLPNLNPEGPLYATEQPGGGGRYRPRTYFGKAQYEDLWLGEKEFLRDPSQNLARTALSGPVFLNFPDGADEQILRGALSLAGYREVPNPLDVLEKGDWRFVERDPQVTVLEIYFKRNTYSWTMIGLTPENRRILCLACGGFPGKSGYPLEDAAERLLEAGAHNALLIDEGADVFQMAAEGDGQLRETLPGKRRRIRAAFIFARPRNEETGAAMQGEQTPLWEVRR